MARKLAGFVVLRDAKFKTHMFGPDDTVPDWAIPLITSRFAWADSGDEPEQPEQPETEQSGADDATEAPKRRTRRTA